jgi:hypothetical protein
MIPYTMFRGIDDLRSMQRDIRDVSIISRVCSVELREVVVSQSGLLLAMSDQHTRCFRFDSFV